jgi:predicted MFS family arabinose efflux permease
VVSAAGCRRLTRKRFGSDASLLLVNQALRALVYGLGSVVIGLSLERSDLGHLAAGGVLATLVAGTAAATVAVAQYGDRLGRRRVYRGLLIVMGLAGTLFAVTESLPLLLLAAATGTISTDVIESGPLGSLEQAMLPDAVGGRARVRIFGTYNAVAALAGSAGALLAGAAGGSRSLLLVYPATAAAAFVAATALSDAVDAGRPPAAATRPLKRSRAKVRRLALLFAIDSFGGGFVVHAFIAYWLSARFDADAGVIAASFFAIGLLQALSFEVAVRVATRAGLLPTMVVTHLASNVLLAAAAFAPSLNVALTLLFARFALSQMDVPTRQAYVVSLVDRDERTAAAAYTNAARYLARPAGPLVGALLASVALGAPFAVAGAVKSAYDLLLFALFRHTPLADDAKGAVPQQQARRAVAAPRRPPLAASALRPDAASRTRHTEAPPGTAPRC